MFYLISSFWIWLLVTLLIGAAVGWITFRGRDERFFRDLWPWALGLGGGALISVLRLLPDRPGFWFDLFMMMAGSYFIGCFLGWLIRSRRGATADSTAPVDGATTLRAAKLDTPVEAAVSNTHAVETVAPEEAMTGLSAPRGGKADDLTRIHAIDPETQAKLNALGIYHYDQLATMTPGQRRWLFNRLGHEGRFPSWWWRWRYDAERLVAGDAAHAPKQATPVGSAASVAAEEGHAGAKPAGLAAPRDGKADDLKRIRGIGKQNEGRLHALGIWHFDQIAAWSAEEVLWIGSYLAFPGRIEREEWVKQAADLAAGRETEFSKRVARGEVATSRDDGGQGQGNIAKLDKPVK